MANAKEALTEAQSNGYFTLVDVMKMSHSRAIQKVREWGEDAPEEAWNYYHESGASMEIR